MAEPKIFTAILLLFREQKIIYFNKIIFLVSVRVPISAW